MPDFPFLPAQQTDVEVLLPLSFIRHKRQLRALLLDDEPWFAVNDLARLMAHPQLAERIQRNLDEDQVQRAWMRNSHGEFQEELLVSDSGLYATLIHFYHPENRCIRQWITRQVIPRLRSEERFDGQRPCRRVLHWLGRELEVLHWQGKAWLPLNECSRLLEREPVVVG
ncbi:BRO family protein [Pseudomonas sp. JS3066]|uniref:BRO-N domain-containing protein n=1 Tax=unclassified Pseudomonas TaxID=196821 RepID=UPI0021151D96|nr:MULTISPECIES: BRO family protein [unclassified Pseudomonas]WVK91712.1 BRO family protein [Pseudomonas sp. JS3066]